MHMENVKNYGWMAYNKVMNSQCEKIWTENVERKEKCCEWMNIGKWDKPKAFLVFWWRCFILYNI